MRTESVKMQSVQPAYTPAFKRLEITPNIPYSMRDAIIKGNNETKLIKWWQNVSLGSSSGSEAIRLEFKNFWGTVVKTIHSTRVNETLSSVNFKSFEAFYNAAKSAKDGDKIAYTFVKDAEKVADKV